MKNIKIKNQHILFENKNNHKKQQISLTLKGRMT